MDRWVFHPDTDLHLRLEATMKINNITAIVALAVLAAVTAIALLDEGVAGMATPFRESFWTWQYFADLVIALGVVMVWMWHDCKSRGKSALPWIGATFFIGSFSPLIYLLLRNNSNTA